MHCCAHVYDFIDMFRDDSLHSKLESFSSDVAELKRQSDALRCRAIAEARLQGCWLPKWQGRPWPSKWRIGRWSSILLTSFDSLAPSQQCRLDFWLRKCWWSDVFSLSAANWLRLTSATDAWSARGMEDRSALRWFILIYQIQGMRFWAFHPVSPIRETTFIAASPSPKGSRWQNSKLQNMKTIRFGGCRFARASKNWRMNDGCLFATGFGVQSQQNMFRSSKRSSLKLNPWRCKMDAR